MGAASNVQPPRFDPAAAGAASSTSSVDSMSVGGASYGSWAFWNATYLKKDGDISRSSRSSSTSSSCTNTSASTIPAAART